MSDAILRALSSYYGSVGTTKVAGRGSEEAQGAQVGAGAAVGAEVREGAEEGEVAVAASTTQCGCMGC